MLTNDEANSPMGVAACGLAFAMQHGDKGGGNPEKTDALQEGFYEMAKAVVDAVAERILSQFL